MCVPGLEEEELEEVMMERVETAISQKSIRFSSNAELAVSSFSIFIQLCVLFWFICDCFFDNRKISEIRTAMEGEFVDSYYEVLHAFGDVLPCAVTVS